MELFDILTGLDVIAKFFRLAIGRLLAVYLKATQVPSAELTLIEFNHTCVLLIIQTKGAVTAWTPTFLDNYFISCLLGILVP